MQGILCTDLSDHYPVFHITENSRNDKGDSLVPQLKRNMKLTNIQKFANEMNDVVWDSVTMAHDPQRAYTEFHKIISEKYNKSFPYRKYTKSYYVSKSWLTPALKESIKRKNKLYANRNKGANPEERLLCYKRYRNRLNHVLRSAERQYYRDLILEHK